jgi:tetratricopeptide (TPR) repeat protein
MPSIFSFHRPMSVLCAIGGLLASNVALNAHSTDPALFPTMIQAFTEELAKAPETDLFIQRGELYMHCREWAKAEADFAAAAQLDPQRLSIGFQRARALLEGGEPARARPFIEHYLGQKPSQAEAWFMRGEIMAALGKTDLARADYAEGFRRAPEASAEQILQWTRLFAALPECDAGEVLSVLDDALARLGPMPALLDYAIGLEVGRKNYDAALARIDRGMMHSRFQGNLLVRRGDVLAKSGRRADAMASYRAALAAIEELPERNRAVADVQKLASDARNAIERLSSTDRTSAL